MGTTPLNSVAGGEVIGGKGAAKGARDFVEVRSSLDMLSKLVP